MQTQQLSPLARTVAESATDIWNDSCATDELQYAIAFGAVGATANPTIVVDVWNKDPSQWADRVRALAVDQPSWNEADLAWAVVGEMSVLGAALLMPTFEAYGGRQGRLSIQTDDDDVRSQRHELLRLGHHSLRRAEEGRIPATAAGIAGIEEATFRGVSINATVSFSVAQAIAAAEAVERGLQRREAAGERTDTMGPVITLMMGRLEDWLRALADEGGIMVHPSAVPWAGVAVFKRAYGVFRERGYRARLLGAAIRHHLHWSELIGGDVIITLPSSWQKRFNASDLDVRPRIDDPVNGSFLDELRLRFPDFERAFEPDGLRVDEFETFAPSVRTLRTFIASYHDLLHLVNEALLPSPRPQPGAM